ncbi:aldehyde dehydrogenase family-domain-containing protein [Pisolithus thermaeus]|nr:aldehyde dehydrogenase family-domain-containing protein [Pisolithus thermaeus]
MSTLKRRKNMRIMKEEIFGSVSVVIKFGDEEDLGRQANDEVCGLVAAVFTKDMNRAITTAHKLKAGMVWVNCYALSNPNVPLGGYKQSVIGQEIGEYALANYVLLTSDTHLMIILRQLHRSRGRQSES